ncbi:SRPBCC family protein [Streptomyces sp. TRM66268-LWL]|uniref:SRPBCC family protein n=1 Tax=Streptomyces polyasparticus TaxID=2767826 RepID=A0ABR7SKL4_9ACTN|nr:SRPBCC family protein [Streptomyces polyasparticus]MBC9715137.1 SRPBCC family protein [Streptomyces polyasparticus]
MGVHNVHERLLAAKESEVGALVDSLSAGAADRLWPHPAWPPMEFDRPLAVGAKGGHGPVRYTVTSYVPGTWIRFAFSGPRGFRGFHEFTVLPVDEERTVLRHTLAMNPRGPARLSWPLAFRRLHDACVEDGLDRAELACTGTVARPARWTAYVRLLRAVARKLH